MMEHTIFTNKNQEHFHGAASCSRVGAASSSTFQRPEYLPVILKNIPEALRAIPQWVCWRGEWDGKRWTKVPYQVNGRKADKTNPAHWHDFSEVAAAIEEMDGIGFVLTANDPFTALDLDNCVIDGVISDEAKSIISRIHSYTEFSPSGHGIRIFVKGSIPRNRRNGKIEVYHHASYVTVTGQTILEVSL